MRETQRAQYIHTCSSTLLPKKTLKHSAKSPTPNLLNWSSAAAQILPQISESQDVFFLKKICELEISREKVTKLNTQHMNLCVKVDCTKFSIVVVVLLLLLLLLLQGGCQTRVTGWFWYLLDLQPTKKFVLTISHVDLLLPSRVLDTCKMQLGLAIECQQCLTNVIISFSISLCICSPPLSDNDSITGNPCSSTILGSIASNPHQLPKEEKTSKFRSTLQLQKFRIHSHTRVLNLVNTHSIVCSNCFVMLKKWINLFANPTSDNSNLNCGAFFKDKENINKLSSLAVSEAVEKRN